MSNNPLDPTFWEAMGITPIVIDSENPESIDAGFKEVKERIVNFGKPTPNNSKDKDDSKPKP